MIIHYTLLGDLRKVDATHFPNSHWPSNCGSKSTYRKLHNAHDYYRHLGIQRQQMTTKAGKQQQLQAQKKTFFYQLEQ